MSKVEEAEVVFGKRWNDWTQAEQKEYVATLAIEDIRVPLNINLAMNHFECLPFAVQVYITTNFLKGK